MAQANTPEKAMVMAYADNAGISTSAAEARMGQEQRLTVGMAEARIEPIDENVDSWVEINGGSLVLHVRTLDTKKLATISSISRSANMAMVVESGAPFVASRTEQVSRRANELQVQIPGLMGFAVDVKTGELVLDIYAEQISDNTKSASRAVDAGAVSEKITGLASRVETSASPARDTIMVNGGVALLTSGKVACTSGFVGTFTSGSSSYQGFLTAAHCGEGLSYYYGTTATGASNTATYKTKVYNSTADIAFHALASGDTKGTQFYGPSPSSPIDQWSYGTAAIGTNVCRRGQTSGYYCGTIDSVTYTPTWAGACLGSTCSATFVKYWTGVKEGDSGGPVWSGTNMPVGIVKGGTDTGAAGAYTVYSKLSNKPSGVTV